VRPAPTWPRHVCGSQACWDSSGSLYVRPGRGSQGTFLRHGHRMEKIAHRRLPLEESGRRTGGDKRAVRDSSTLSIVVFFLHCWGGFLRAVDHAAARASQRPLASWCAHSDASVRGWRGQERADRSSWTCGCSGCVASGMRSLSAPWHCNPSLRRSAEARGSVGLGNGAITPALGGPPFRAGFFAESPHS
jgi:hypothetical protein